MKDKDKMITLEIEGKEIPYSVAELEAIVSFATNPYREAHAKSSHLHSFQLPGPKFTTTKVIPLEIDRAFFAEKRMDNLQELARCRILSAIELVRKYPDKYGKPFELVLPTNPCSVKEFKEMYEWKSLGELEFSTMVDEYLSWGFLLQTGELTWERLCNRPDMRPYPRLVQKDGLFFTIGGGRMTSAFVPPATISLKFDYLKSNAIPKGRVVQFKHYL